MAGEEEQAVTKLSPRWWAMSSETITGAGVGGADPRPAAVTFITTEHFTLQGARAATIAESTGRATMFPGSVSAGLVALG
jgi:hypothetical protein